MLHAEAVRRLPTITDYTAVPVTTYGLGLVKGVVDQTSDFYVDTKGLRGSLKVQVDGKAYNIIYIILLIYIIF